MEKEKIVEITDFGNKNVFKIHLFGIQEGIAFIDKAGSALFKKDLNEPVSYFLSSLLPLASLMSLDGKTVITEKMSVNACEDIFQNPLSVIELGKEILEFQKVFFQDSKIFHDLAKQANLGFLTQILGSQESSQESLSQK